QSGTLRLHPNPFNQPRSSLIREFEVELVTPCAWAIWLAHRPQPGESGSPVTNSSGQLAAQLNKAYFPSPAPPVTLSHAVQANALHRLIEQDRTATGSDK